MATNFSPCKGSYVLNQFPSNVMFAMNGFTYQPVERYRAIMALLFVCKCFELRPVQSFVVWEKVNLKTRTVLLLFVRSLIVLVSILLNDINYICFAFQLNGCLFLTSSWPLPNI